MQDTLPAPGATVWIRERRWRVERAHRRRNVTRLDVRGDRTRASFLLPFDRLIVPRLDRRPRRVRPQHAAARLAGLLAHLPSARAVNAAVEAGVVILPYQLEPALAVVAGGARRILVADDVGLGKTIQAGFIVAETLRRDGAARVLIIAPASLAEQWRDELAQRVRVDAEIVDRRVLDESASRLAADDSPWRAPGVRIVSPDFLKQPHVFDAVPTMDWDVIVIDEAHTVCGDSERHARCHAIAARARVVVLLTATPHDGDPLKFARLLALGAVVTGDPLVVFRRTRASLGMASGRAVRTLRVQISPAEARVFDALDRFGAVVRRAAADRHPTAGLLVTMLRKRALSTMHAVRISIDRRIAWLDASPADRAGGWTQGALDFCDADDLDADERRAITVETGVDPTRERGWLVRIGALATAAARHETKIARLVRLLRRTRESAIVFTEFRHSLEVTGRGIARVASVATLHGGLSASDRRSELARFLDGGARILLATDVAGTGLNLHGRARWVITLDRPWNPARLDQRIGRVDRIGQTRSVHHTILSGAHAAETGLEAHVDRRSALAKRAIDPVGVDNSADDRHDDHLRLPASCVTYARAARRHATTLAHRRALADRWKGVVGVTPVRSVLRRGPCVGTRVVAVFVVPLLDLAGHAIERRAVAVSIGSRDVAVTRHSTEALDRMIGDAAAAAARTLEPRARRLRRWLADDEAATLARDAAIDATLHDRLTPAPADVGLFDRRDTRAYDAARSRQRLLERETRQRHRDRQLARECRVGAPLLVAVLEPRR